MHYNPGMGIYQFASLLPEDPADLDVGAENDYCFDHPYIAGNVVYCPWAKIEPEENLLLWDRIDGLLEPWSTRGKRSILRICPCRRESSTPKWVFKAGARCVVHRGISAHGKWDAEYENHIPVYWDRIFLEKYENLIKEFALRYDSNPYVEAVQVSLGKWGEAFLGSEIDLGYIKNTLQDWIKEGYTGKLANETFKHIIRLYKRYFIHTPLIVMLGGPFADNDFYSMGSMINTEELAEFCVEQHISIQQNGMGPNYGNYVNMPNIFHRYYRCTKVMYEMHTALESIATDNIGSVAKEMLKQHISYAFFYPKDINHEHPATLNALEYLFNRIGYQIVLETVCLPETTSRRCVVQMKWRNDGCAPVYDKWNQTVLIYDSNGGLVAESAAKTIPAPELWTENQTIYTQLVFNFPPELPEAEYQLKLFIRTGKNYPVFVSSGDVRKTPRKSEITLGKTRLKCC
jgi:hypothetical protein